MVRKYRPRSGQRRYDERSFSVRAVHREPLDLHLLAQVLIRQTLQQTGESRAARRAIEPPETFRQAPAPFDPAAHTIQV